MYSLSQKMTLALKKFFLCALLFLQRGIRAGPGLEFTRKDVIGTD